MSALTWLALAIAVAVYYGPMQTLLESTARNKLFRMRDELFDQAAAGETSFDSEEYLQAREMLNKLIRFTHIVKWHNVLFMYKAFGSKVEPDASDDTENALYKQFRSQVAVNMIGLMVLRSPLLLAMLFPVMLIGFVSSNSLLIKRQIIKVGKLVEHESRAA